MVTVSRSVSKQTQRIRCSRPGFTLLELLVVISIISVLMSLILPVIQSAREAARRTRCMHRLRNLSVAMLSNMDTHQRFPAAAYWGGGSKSGPGPHHNWVVQLLPWLDRTDLYDRWDMERLATDSPNKELASLGLAFLVCPSDSSATSHGDLSYALNGGIGESDYVTGVHDCIVDPFGGLLDLNGNGLVCLGTGISDGEPSDRQIFKKLGLFFNENWKFQGTPGYQGTRRHHTAASLTDGFSNTLMMTENVRTGADFAAGWATCDSRRTKVYFSSEICHANVCTPGNTELSLANSSSRGINAGISAPEGQSPWPGSEHPGGVNMALADGSVRFVAEQIAGALYFQLFTPQGAKLDGTALESLGSGF
jgi:prepilin-type N-terminal cleavage/methylation domain-containing protein/prepilin-type processing-associated H-X9-DG protein